MIEYEDFDTISEVDSRIRNRKFVEFFVNDEVLRNTKYGNGLKKYVLGSIYIPPPDQPINYCKITDNLNEVNQIVNNGNNWYKLYLTRKGKFIIIWNVKDV